MRELAMMPMETDTLLDNPPCKLPPPPFNKASESVFMNENVNNVNYVNK